MQFIKKNLLLTIIIIIALTLRLAEITHYGNFWFDEMFSFTYSQKPWLDSLKFWTWETNPPLHMVFLKFWFYIFPANEFFARLPSLIFGVLSVGALYNFTFKLFNKKIAFISALLLALHPYHIFISSTARSYSLLILLSIISLNYCFKIFVYNQNRKKNKIILAISNLLLAYTHLTASFIILGQIIIVFLNEPLPVPRAQDIRNSRAGRSLRQGRRVFNLLARSDLVGISLRCVNKKEKLKHWFKINLLPFCLWLVWAIPSAYNKLNSTTFNGAWFLNMDKSLESVITNISVILIGPTKWQYGFIPIILFILILIYLIYQQKRIKQTTNNLLFIMILFFIPISTIILLGLWNVRFLAITIPLNIIIFAYFLGSSIKTNLILSLITILVMTPGLVNHFRFLTNLAQWDSINNFVIQHQDKNKNQVLIYNLYYYKILFERYYQQNIPVVYYNSNKVTNWDENLIKNNYIRYQHNQTEIIKWLKKIKINQYDEIFLLQNEMVYTDIASTLKQLGWQAKTPPVYPRLVEHHTLKIYAKDKNYNQEK